MKRHISLQSLLLMLCVAFAFTATAQDTPRWVKKGTKSINEQRSNDSYVVESFNTHGFDLEELENKSTDVLVKYVEEKYGALAKSINIETLTGGTQPVYEITYANAEKEDNTIIAKRIDAYSTFDDYELNVFQFEYYQLYAITRPNVAPLFDSYSYTNHYGAATTAMSFVPGMAQLYKSQDTKAYVIIGSEIFFAGASLIFEYKRNDCAKWAKKAEPAYVASWRSKQDSWKDFEIGAISCFAAVYIYNVIDGMTSKGARQIKVRKMHEPHMSAAPFITPDFAGLSFTYTF